MITVTYSDCFLSPAHHGAADFPLLAKEGAKGRLRLTRTSYLPLTPSFERRGNRPAEETDEH